MGDLCNIADCARPAFARGWCRMHYARWWEHGDPLTVRRSMPPSGAVAAFLESATVFAGDECLPWPFTRNNKGYGQTTKGGRRTLAHRIVCEVRNGPPPTPEHVAAHSCGNGHLGCVNGRHLRWATPPENTADMIGHCRSTRGRSRADAVLTEQQVLEIYRRAIDGEVQGQIAREFRITQTAVSAIKRGRNWGWLTRAAT